MSTACNIKLGHNSNAFYNGIADFIPSFLASYEHVVTAPFVILIVFSWDVIITAWGFPFNKGSLISSQDE